MEELRDFLEENQLGHLTASLTDQGAEPEFLQHANDHELHTLVPMIVEKGKLRIALERLKMTHNVFVYGTLKRNEPNHHWLTDPQNGHGKFITEGETKNKYPLIIATRYNIPFLLYSPGEGHHIKGEVYEVDDKMMKQLDILEDHPNYYVREIDDVIVMKDKKKEIAKCWIYFLKKFKPELLKRPQMDSYSSDGSHGLPYMERSKRDPTYDYKVEVRD